MDNIVLTESYFYILIALYKPNHGYGVIQDIANMTDGRVNMGPGTLYGAINALLERGWIKLYNEEFDSRKKKEYVITESGKITLMNEEERLKELMRNYRMVLEGVNNEDL